MLLVVPFAAVLSSCSDFFDNEQSVTINLPLIQSSSRAISSEKIYGLKNATASYRVVVNIANGQRLEKSGSDTKFSFHVYAGAEIEITVECFNSNGDVIVRAKKLRRRERSK